MEVTSHISKRRRVLHFLESGGLYGAESVVLNLSREMQKAPCYQPVIGCIVQNINEHVDLYDKAISFGIESHKIVINNKKFPIDILYFLFQLKKLKIDLVHSHNYKASIIGIFSKIIFGIPFLPTCHLWYWSKNTSVKYHIMTAIEIFLYRHVKIVISVSQPIKETLINKGVDSKKIYVIKNGINLDDFYVLNNEDKNKIKISLKLEKNVPIIVNVGRLTEQKAQKNIIASAKILKNKKIKFKILIVGDGELKNSLEKQIVNLRVQDCVKIIGFRDDVKTLLQISDIFLLPSLDEGLPISLLEALASKIPVITTFVGDIPELLDGNRACEKINIDDVNDIANSIIKMINNLSFYKNMVHDGYEKIYNDYSSRRLYCNYDEIYNKIIK